MDSLPKDEAYSDSVEHTRRWNIVKRFKSLLLDGPTDQSPHNHPRHDSQRQYERWPYRSPEYPLSLMPYLTMQQREGARDQQLAPHAVRYINLLSFIFELRLEPGQRGHPIQTETATISRVLHDAVLRHYIFVPQSALAQGSSDPSGHFEVIMIEQDKETDLPVLGHFQLSPGGEVSDVRYPHNDLVCAVDDILIQMASDIYAATHGIGDLHGEVPPA